MILSTFSCVCLSYVFLLWKNVYSGPLYIFKWILCLFVGLVLCCTSSLILNFEYFEYYPLSDISFTNILPHYVVCWHYVDIVTSIFPIMLSAKAFYVGVVPIVYFWCCFLCLWRHGDTPIKMFLWLISRNCCLCFLLEFYGFRSHI